MGIALAVVVGGALPASAAEVVRPDGCGWAPGDGETESIPGTGIKVPIPATDCQVVFLDDGRTRFVIRGQLPAGTVKRTLVLKDENSILVVTTSGQIINTGTFTI